MPNDHYYEDVDEDIREDVRKIVEESLTRAQSYGAITRDEVLEIIRSHIK